MEFQWNIFYSSKVISDRWFFFSFFLTKASERILVQFVISRSFFHSNGKTLTCMLSYSRKKIHLMVFSWTKRLVEEFMALSLSDSHSKIRGPAFKNICQNALEFSVLQEIYMLTSILGISNTRKKHTEVIGTSFQLHLY